MAIGTAAAIGIGVLGAGSILSSGSNRRAARDAANVSAQNNAANVALQREVYGQNRQALSPFMGRGNAAGEQLNAMLLGGGTTQPQAATAAGTQPSALSGWGGGGGTAGGFGMGGGGFNPALMQDFSPTTSSSNNNGGSRGFWNIGPGTYGPGIPGMPGTSGAAGPVNTQIGAGRAFGDPFQTFRDSTGYQFRMDEAMDAVNSGYAAGGVLQSGAALTAAMDRAGDVADNTFNQYAGLLQGQQAVGAGAASSLAGVGQNFANSVTASNDQNSANQANALLVRGQNGFGNTLGMVGGVLAGL